MSSLGELWTEIDSDLQRVAELHSEDSEKMKVLENTSLEMEKQIQELYEALTEAGESLQIQRENLQSLCWIGTKHQALIKSSLLQIKFTINKRLPTVLTKNKQVTVQGSVGMSVGIFVGETLGFEVDVTGEVVGTSEGQTMG